MENERCQARNSNPAPLTCVLDALASGMFSETFPQFENCDDIVTILNVWSARKCPISIVRVSEVNRLKNEVSVVIPLAFSIFAFQGHLHEESWIPERRLLICGISTHVVLWHNVGRIAFAAPPVLASPVAAISCDIATTQTACNVNVLEPMKIKG